MLLASDGITIGEKWTTVLPSIIDGDFFYSVPLNYLITPLSTSIKPLNFSNNFHQSQKFHMGRFSHNRDNNLQFVTIFR